MYTFLDTFQTAQGERLIDLVHEDDKKMHVGCYLLLFNCERATSEFCLDRFYARNKLHTEVLVVKIVIFIPIQTTCVHHFFRSHFLQKNRYCEQTELQKFTT